MAIRECALKNQYFAKLFDARLRALAVMFVGVHPYPLSLSLNLRPPCRPHAASLTARQLSHNTA